MIAALCDDNQEILTGLNSALRDISSGEIRTELFRSGEALVKAYEDGKPSFDVVFLDIEMDGMDGVEAANCIRRIDKQVLIVFVTSHKKHMQRSFVCQPFRFLVKPVKTKELTQVCRDISSKLSETPSTFVFMEEKQHVRLFCDDIVFFESRGHWLILHKKDRRTHRIRKTMQALLETIDKSRFCQVHRALVVNLSFVRQAGNGELSLYEYDKTLPISRTYKNEFANRFLAFEERKYFL